MPRIREATGQDVEAVASYLASRLGGGRPDRYRRYFETPWSRDAPNIGWLIDDGGRIGGFLGAIYARRSIGGREHAFCNLHSWSVDEPYRKLSLGMMQKLLEQPEVTYTCFSPSERVREVLRFFKFSVLDREKVILSPLSGWGSRGGVRVLTGEDLVPALDERMRRVYLDHRGYRLGHALLLRGDRRCYVVTARRGRVARAFADVLYASDPELFVEGIAALHGRLLRQHRTILTGIDARFVTRRPRAAVGYRGLRPSMFRSASLAPTQVDALYTELVPMYG